MANFTAYQSILPDPNNKISRSGNTVNGGSSSASEQFAKFGPGFASVKFSSKQPVMMDRTNSGRVITRAIAGHTWQIDINYNPLTREEFEPVYAFLMAQNGKLNPFLLQLPQYLSSQNSGFATLSNNGTLLTLNEGSSVPAGRTYFRASWNGAANYPAVGDVFNISDSSNSNHTKAYMVTRFEMTSDSNTSFDASTLPSGLSAPFNVRIHFTPSLTAATSNGSTLDFTSPTFRVIQTSDVREYSLGVDSLYKFGLKVEEAGI